MPNHVINEVVFCNVDAEQQASILMKVSSEQAAVDFEILLPVPINLWLWSAGAKHNVFPGTALDWCRANWSTKWNAYGLREEGYVPIVQTGDTLTITFQSAWSPPRGWLCALFNSTSLPFDYRFLDEGAEAAVSGWFKPDGGVMGAEWGESGVDEQTQRRLHKMLWGVETFEDDEPAQGIEAGTAETEGLGSREPGPAQQDAPQ